MWCFGQALGEPLYRVSTGNYEYRLILRCRQEARARFAKIRKDVLEKMELLDQKHGKCSSFSFSLNCSWYIDFIANKTDLSLNSLQMHEGNTRSPESQKEITPSYQVH